jgi:hypothetical protein
MAKDPGAPQAIRARAAQLAGSLGVDVDAANSPQAQ